MLKILDVEGAVARAGSRWKLVPDADWSYDAERYAQVTALRRAEQRAMAAFGSDGRCLMRVLQEQLDDPSPADCGRCSVCAGPRFAAPLDPALVEAAGRHLRSTPIELEVKKMAPDASGVMRKIPADALVEPGWALARFGDGGWWPAIERGLESGEFEDDVVDALADIVRAGGVDWVTSVPSVRLGETLARLGQRVAGALSVPYLELVARVTNARPSARWQTPPSRPPTSAAPSGSSDAAARNRRAARRSPHLGLDARDGRRPAPPRRRGAGGAACARHSAVAYSGLLTAGRARSRSTRGGELRRFIVVVSVVCALALPGVMAGVASATPDAHAAQTIPLVVVKKKNGATAALVRVFIHGHLVPMLVDTGATVSVINRRRPASSI